MSEKNPKEKFIEKLLDIMYEFENATGAEIETINIQRIREEFIGDFVPKSIIRSIELGMK